MIETSPLFPDLKESTDTNIETRLLSPVARCDNPQAQQIVTLSLQCRDATNVETWPFLVTSTFHILFGFRLAEKRQNANALASGLDEGDQY